MVDSRFFGSPTKIFEYMAMGGGIVASDLEQIGEVLSPALRVSDLSRAGSTVSDQRSVLCTPGDVDEFVAGVVGLVRAAGALSRARPRTRGRRLPITTRGSGTSSRLWSRSRQSRAVAAPAEAERRAQGRDRRRLQRCRFRTSGTTTLWVRRRPAARQPHTLEWFLEVERYRLRRLRAVDARGDGVRRARRPTGARDRRRDGDRPRAVREERRERHGRRSLRRAPEARAGEFPRCAVSPAASFTTTPSHCRSTTAASTWSTRTG